MADDKILPPVFKKVNPKTQTQEFGLTFFVAVMLLSIFLLGSFEKIVNYVIFIDSISLASAAFAIFILRRNASGPFDGFRLRGLWRNLVPLLFVITLLFVTYNTIISDMHSAGYGLIIFIAGFPLYHLMKKVISQHEEEKNK